MAAEARAGAAAAAGVTAAAEVAAPVTGAAAAQRAASQRLISCRTRRSSSAGISLTYSRSDMPCAWQHERRTAMCGGVQVHKSAYQPPSDRQGPCVSRHTGYKVPALQCTLVTWSLRYNASWLQGPCASMHPGMARARSPTHLVELLWPMLLLPLHTTAA